MGVKDLNIISLNHDSIMDNILNEKNQIISIINNSQWIMKIYEVSWNNINCRQNNDNMIL